MNFSTKKLITKFRSYTSIFLALILLSTAFTFRILANYGGIMKNITMADNVIVYENIEKHSSKDNDEAEEILNNLDEIQNDSSFIFTGGKNIKYNNYNNGVLSFSLSIEGTVDEQLLKEKDVYTETITCDTLGVYANKYTKLPDDDYSLTKITVPGKNNFLTKDGNNLFGNKYNLVIKVLKNGKTRKFKNYEKIYEGEWENKDIVKDLTDVIAVRVEISGLKEKINKLNVNIEGTADLSSYLSTDSNTVSNSQDEYNTCYLISEYFLEYIDKDGNDITGNISNIEYLNSNLYTEDFINYEKGLVRAYDNLKIQEQLKHVVILTKHDKSDKNKLLENAEYGLYPNTKVNVYGKTYLPGELIENKFSNDKGQIQFEIYGFLNNFYIKEIAPPEGYYSSDSLFNLKDYQQIVSLDDGIKIMGRNDTNIETNAEDDNSSKIIKNASSTKIVESANSDNIIYIQAYDEMKSDSDKQKEQSVQKDEKQENDNKDSNEKNSIKINQEDNKENTTNNSKKTIKINNKEIKINKEIKAESLQKAHGDANFIFKIVGTNKESNNKITLYRVISFSDKDIQLADSKGNIQKSIVILDLPGYNYEVTEEVNSRYIINSIIPITNATVINNVGIINLQEKDKAEITFKSNKNKNSLLSDNKLIINKVTKQP